MSGPEHYRAAEQHLREAFACTEEQSELSTWNQRQAQVHATLALAAAYACARTPDMNGWDAEAWQAAAGTPRTETP
jgi:hypothetical protein